MRQIKRANGQHKAEKWLLGISMKRIGYNYRMSNIVAGVVHGQIPHLEEHIAKKKAIYERYKEGF